MLAPRTLLPVVLALVSVAVGCAAPTAEERAPGASEMSVPSDPSADPMAAALSGSAGMNAPSHASAPAVSGLGTTHAASDVIGELAVKETGARYDLLSYDFAVTGGATTFSATGGMTATPPKVSAVQVRVRARDKAPALGNGAFSGKTSTFTLSTLDATSGGKPVPFVLAEYALVGKATTQVTEDGVVETVELAPRVVTITRGKAQVKIDPAVKSTGGPLPLTPACTTASGQPLPLGGFAVAPPGGVAKGTAVDAIDVQVSRVTTTSATGGAAAATLELDMLAVEGALGTAAVCAVAQVVAGRGAPTFSAEVDVATIDGVVPQTRWEACSALPKTVRFQASADRATERVELTSAALVRTDWTYDAFTGTELGKTVNGWSFAANASATSCTP